VGFFECVDNEVAAHLLFDAARNRLEGKGCEGMDGPVNFGANHMNWGLLVEDFHATSIGMPYSKPYYQRLFEGYGFNVFFKQQSREMDLTRPMPERFAKVTQYAKERHQIIIKPALREELDSLVKDFVLIFNEGWQFHEGFIPLTEREVKEILAELKKIYIEDLFRFAYVNGEAAGFMIALPDLNQIFKPYRGKPGIWGFLKFVIRKRNNYRSYLQSGQLDRIRLLIMGVRPKFQKLGLDAVMSYDARERFYQLGFKRIELSWVGDFNPKMMSLMEATGAHTSCMHHTYRFMFDPALRQTYSMVIPMDTKERYLQEQGQPEETQTESSTDGTTEA
jgi:GNAT superfamily N-acetyltransferase